MDYPDIQCPKLGLFRYDPTNDWYAKQIEIQQSTVSIYLEMDEEQRFDAALHRANNFVDELELHVHRAKEYAASSLLALKNENWLDENEQPLTPQQFTDRMLLQAILIDSTGTVAFYHQDGDLFFGHCILVTMDIENQFIDADISG